MQSTADTSIVQVHAEKKGKNPIDPFTELSTERISDHPRSFLFRPLGGGGGGGFGGHNPEENPGQAGIVNRPMTARVRCWQCADGTDLSLEGSKLSCSIHAGIFASWTARRVPYLPDGLLSTEARFAPETIIIGSLGI